ncbi:nitroreductase family deazaflavin-dependent oxidoreductase [Nocardia zapadnayensis]|uniref:nitroreductase family deazaflavin-dependent oxidoreductase n=1 Tax=Nocardia rhamnosiphila TaxID=426716 RepID=UPI002246518D|nr:nitroreductase family deazaflavin-dependent oxidoreductase [Nocardia zapadnayensis]MCX0271364.1 nitroreductase family deazaflavin-dependent oxidoreductase [Nocardia zapadnayensis]
MNNRPKQLDSPLVQTVIKYMSKVNTWTYRKTGGRVGGTWRVGAGFRKPVPTLLLEHTGRKSGKQFTVPLLFLRDDANIIVVASQGGMPKNPQWYHNLVAAPDTTVQIGKDRIPVRARLADDAERDRLWPKLLELYADFDNYQSWTERRIPVFVLEPRTI